MRADNAAAICRDVRKDEELDKCNRFDAGSRRS